MNVPPFLFCGPPDRRRFQQKLVAGFPIGHVDIEFNTLRPLAENKKPALPGLNRYHIMWAKSHFRLEVFCRMCT